MLNMAVRAARAAGEVILRNIDRVRDLEVKTKAHNDFVTEVDRRAELIIIDTLHKAYPGHAFIAEEGGARGTSEFVWVIDPLDGTTNYLHGYPQFGVSIALKYRDQLELGVVYDPMRNELFTAQRGAGAFLDGRRIRVSQQTTLEGALIGTGFPIRNSELLPLYFRQFESLLPMTAGLRRAGAASLDLAYLACARMDGFWELGLMEWDIAAGALLIVEAGGMVGELDGQSDYLQTGNIMAAPPKLFPALQEVLARC
jgi:myo-inositol-1(or 4)-monophosphatase